MSDSFLWISVIIEIIRAKRVLYFVAIELQFRSFGSSRIKTRLFETLWFRLLGVIKSVCTEILFYYLNNVVRLMWIGLFFFWKLSLLSTTKYAKPMLVLHKRVCLIKWERQWRDRYDIITLSNALIHLVIASNHLSQMLLEQSQNRVVFIMS